MALGAQKRILSHKVVDLRPQRGLRGAAMDDAVVVATRHLICCELVLADALGVGDEMSLGPGAPGVFEGRGCDGIQGFGSRPDYCRRRLGSKARGVARQLVC